MMSRHDQDNELSPELAAEMEKHGITRFPIYHFRCGAFTYTNLRDAVAQAKRSQGDDN